jgi:hypothetical protein
MATIPCPLGFFMKLSEPRSPLSYSGVCNARVTEHDGVFTVLVLGAETVGDFTHLGRQFEAARMIVCCGPGLEMNTRSCEYPNIQFLVGDPLSRGVKERVLALTDRLDLVIDIGAGLPSQAVGAFAHYWDHVASGGSYLFLGLDRVGSHAETVFPEVSIGDFAMRLWQVAHHNRNSTSAERSALLAPFGEALPVEFRESGLARVHEVELSIAHCVVRKGNKTCGDPMSCWLPEPMLDAKASAPEALLVQPYETLEIDQELAARTREVFALQQEVRSLRARCDSMTKAELDFVALQESRSWRLTRPLRVLIGLLLRESGYVTEIRGVFRLLAGRFPSWLRRVVFSEPHIEERGVARPRLRRDVPVDIVVVRLHGEADSIRRCLESVLRFTLPPYRLFLTEAGSGGADIHVLEQLAAAYGAHMLPHDQDRGLGSALPPMPTPDFNRWVALLRDDVVVSEGWLDGLAEALSLDPQAAAVGSLTTAMLNNWFTDLEGDFADRTAEWADAEKVAASVFRVGCRQPIRVSRLDGACVLFRSGGLVKAARCTAEEARTNGGRARAIPPGRTRLVVAGDVFVGTAVVPCENVRELLRASVERSLSYWTQMFPTSAHDGSVPLSLAAVCGRAAEDVRWGRVAMVDRSRFEGRRVAFLLSADASSARSAFLLAQAHALGDLGIDAWIVRIGSETAGSSAESELPILHAKCHRHVPEALADTGVQFDAVVAVGAELLEAVPKLGTVRACYLWAGPGARPEIVDTEQLRILTGEALSDLRVLTESDKALEALTERVALRAAVVGPSTDTAIFRPPLRYGRRLGGLRIMILTGCRHDDLRLAVSSLPAPFRSRLVPRDVVVTSLAIELRRLSEYSRRSSSLQGVAPTDLANRLRRCDVFLTLCQSTLADYVALAAMACGCAVVIARNDGAPEFAHHEENALVVVANRAANAVARLARDRALCDRLRLRAASEATARSHRRAALAMANALFDADVAERPL